MCEARSWAQLHAEWEARADQDKTRARILLLYSPDTKLFKELQAALKSFLQLACHSDVYDLFDDALFDTIALDPSDWLEKFLNDRNVKIIVISSIGKVFFIKVLCFRYCFKSFCIISVDLKRSEAAEWILPTGYCCKL